MTQFYTRKGDDGYTGLLGEGRVPKHDLRPEAVGAIDEASAALGWARAHSQAALSPEILISIQRDLYGLMAEIAATPENAARFRTIGAERLAWLEAQIELVSSQTVIPTEFILPGDTRAGAAMALARTVVRRAERRVAELFLGNQIENRFLLQYINRLSSLLFILELLENQAAGYEKPTLAKGIK
ncbi:MAG TPA: cob(I)yrinic acid a,c-diamide adenosyltransferase [Anaerolineales bacterium]|nr:cob(I)yrinic acid a,c-diamide adenosyltransferase [Anaerolineales bacterium]